MKSKNSFQKINHGLALILGMAIFSSCGKSSTDEEGSTLKKDTIATDQAEMIEIEEMEMESVYEVTNTKTKKTTIMTQEEYLESAIWENPDCVIKEMPMVK